MNERDSKNYVDLVDLTGNSIGSVLVKDAHSLSAKLHRAFSVILVNEFDEILLQQRASTKTRWPLFIGNSCCGHPTSKENLVQEAQKRVKEELGIECPPLKEIGQFTYKATFKNYVEWEFDHFLIGRMKKKKIENYNHEECNEVFWMHADEVKNIKNQCPWLDNVIEIFLNN